MADNKETFITPSLYTERGGTGLKHSGRRIFEEDNPDFSGQNKYKKIKEMTDDDPVVGAILYAIINILKGVKIKVEPYSDLPRHRADAEFLETCLEDMQTPMKSTVAQALSFIPYGFAIQEVVLKKRNGRHPLKMFNSKFNDGRIGWAKFAPRAQHTIEEWDISPHDDVLGVWQNLYYNTRRNKKTGRVFIPASEFIHYKIDTYNDNPEGKSALRNCLRPHTFKRRVEEIEGIGLERDLAGLPFMRLPSRVMSENATPSEKLIYEEAKNIIENIRNDEQAGLILPGDTDRSGNNLYSFELLSTGGQKQFDTSEIINRYDQRITMSFLADFILLGSDKVGSLSLADSKTSIFGQTLGVMLDEVTDKMTEHAVPQLFALNGNVSGDLPRITHVDVETPDLKELGAYIRNLASSGASLFPDDDLQDTLMEAANLPTKVVSLGGPPEDTPPSPQAPTRAAEGEPPEAGESFDQPSADTSGE